MPGTPVIANRTPGPDATGMLLTDYFRLSLRDTLTRVDLGGFGAQVCFSGDAYDAQAALPEIELPDSNTFVAAFSDSGPTAVPSTEVVHRGVIPPNLILTRINAGADHRGAQFIAAPSTSRPYMAEVEVDADPANLTPGNEPYIVAGGGNRYFGVCLGSVYGPLKTGVFIFYMDDGAGNRFLRISGPDNGTGARPGFVDHVYDWSVRTTFKVVWDVGAPHDVVRVYLRPAASSVINAAMLEFPMAGMATFLPGGAFGGIPVDPAADPVDEVLVFLNLDSRTNGDFIRSDFIRAFSYGRPLAVSGIAGLGAELVVFSSDVVEAPVGEQPRDALVPWAEHFLDPLAPPMAGVTGSLGVSEAGWAFSKVDGTDNGELPCFVRREEPAMAPGGIWLLAEFSAADVEHSTTVATGMGFRFDNGAGLLDLMLIDTFAIAALGVYRGGDKRLPASYDYGVTIDWSTNIVLKMWLDAPGGELQVFLNGSPTPYLTFNLAGLPASLGTPQVAVGHVDFYPGTPVFGTLEIARLSYGLDAVVYSPSSGNLPPAAASPWIEVSTGAGASALVGGLCVLTDPDFGPLAGPPVGRIYEQRSLAGSVDAFTGMTVEARFAVSDWTDDVGSPNPAFVPIETGVLLDDGGTTVVLRFVHTLEGNFAYIDTSIPAQALADVIGRTEDGRAISSDALDITSPHVYRLEKRPRHHVRLYIDDSPTPAIDIPWDEADLPGPTLVGAGVAWGSFDTHRASTSSWGDVIYMTSNGYDVAMRPSVLPENYPHVFDSIAELVIETDGV